MALEVSRETGEARTQTYRRVTFTKNTSQAQGGAIAVDLFPGKFTLNLETSMFLGNKAAFDGGAVGMLTQANGSGPAPGTLKVVNSTLTANSAGADGGAIRLLTFAHPTAALTATLTNNIAWGNQAQAVADDIRLVQGGGAGPLSVTASFNDIGDLVSAGASVTQSNTLNVDPQVNKKTGLLEAGSPMIDAGTCVAPTTDIQGQPRPNPAGANRVACDIGADEF